jgi:hypothetical protein
MNMANVIGRAELWMNYERVHFPLSITFCDLREQLCERNVKREDVKISCRREIGGVIREARVCQPQVQRIRVQYIISSERRVRPTRWCNIRECDPNGGSRAATLFLERVECPHNVTVNRRISNDSPHVLKLGSGM